MALSYSTVVRKQVVVARQPNVDFDTVARYSKDPFSIVFATEPEDRDMPAKAKKPSGKQHDRLIAARREFGMSQDEFAKKTGVSKKDIGECEAGKSTIPSAMWHKIDAAITVIRREKAKQAEAAAKAEREFNRIMREEKAAKLAAESDAA
jgi:DNA-binding XRE family transcriptional regulator